MTPRQSAVIQTYQQIGHVFGLPETLNWLGPHRPLLIMMVCGEEIVVIAGIFYSNRPSTEAF